MGMREGVGGKQQGQGRCGERYNPFLHLSRGHMANHSKLSDSLDITCADEGLTR